MYFSYLQPSRKDLAELGDAVGNRKRFLTVPLFPDNLHDNLSVPAPVVKVDKNYLLPGAQRQLPADEGNGQERLHQRGTDVGFMTPAVSERSEAQSVGGIIP